MPSERRTEVTSAAEIGTAAELVLGTIRSRRVTRSFSERAVEHPALLRVLEAGRWATSGGNRRIHRFLVVRDPAMIVRLRAVTPGMFSNPPALIVICTDAARAARELVQLEHDATTWIDVGTAAMTMMIAAHALGLGTCPVTSFSHVAVRVILDVPPTIEPELFVLVGYPLGPARSAGATIGGPKEAAVLPAGLVSWGRLGRETPEPIPVELVGRGPMTRDAGSDPRKDRHP